MGGSVLPGAESTKLVLGRSYASDLLGVVHELYSHCVTWKLTGSFYLMWSTLAESTKEEQRAVIIIRELQKISAV